MRKEAVIVGPFFWIESKVKKGRWGRRGGIYIGTSMEGRVEKVDVEGNRRSESVLAHLYSPPT